MWGQLCAQASRRGMRGRTRGRMRAVRGDAGMVTSEYAMGLIAAVGFAGLLYKVVTSGQVRAALQAVVEKALDVQF
ncbi:DUF4244 domain-containing protein [Streptomyces longisporoflavus]|uniref:DUF4244 domain-containing protein n=1 Tax=Streptomyces longisporoflavus TaxID=28044 RepID=A0ABW7QXT8_9ACTN